MSATLTAPRFDHRSLSGRSWRLKPHDSREAERIAAVHGLSPLLAIALAARGVRSEETTRFLSPKLRDLAPDPFALLDMERAASRLADAIEAGEPLGVIADYDVDGASSAALIARYFRGFGLDVAIDVPDRMAEGYGPNPFAFDRLRAAGRTLVLTVDGGALAFDAIEHARAQGQEVIVLDHHAGLERQPAALAVVNPNRPDDASDLGHLAGVGVAFLAALAVDRTLRGRDPARPRFDLRALLDLVALGTICDVVPLIGVNRAFVRTGLEVAARGGNPGLLALAREAKLEPPITASSFGFVLGPRINAGGRVGVADTGARLLATDEPAEAQELAVRLDKANRERRRIERAALEEALGQAAAKLEDDPPILIAAGEDWHPGVIGIVASRLVDRFARPAVAIALSGETGKASGRSIKGFDLGAAVLEARELGLIEKGGGHPMAAGLEVARDKIAALERHLRGRAAAAFGPEGPRKPPLEIDLRCAVGGADLAFARALERLGPFGASAPAPRLLIEGARVVDARRVGKDHVQAHFGADDGARLSAIGFGIADTPLGEALMSRPREIAIVGKLKVEHWGGRARAKFEIEDGALGDVPFD